MKKECPFCKSENVFPASYAVIPNTPLVCGRCHKDINQGRPEGKLSVCFDGGNIQSLDDLSLFKIIKGVRSVRDTVAEERIRKEWERRNLPIERIEELKAQLILGEKLGASEWGDIKACVICHAGKISLKKEKSCFGLFSKDWIVCEQCSAAFPKKGLAWKWAKKGSEGNLIWGRYGNQSLSVREWQRIGQGGISDAEQRDADISSSLEKIRAGSLKVKIIETSPSVILQNNEEILVALPNICLLETRAVRMSKGSYGGPRIRLSRRISYGFGSFASRSESEQLLRKIDDGILVITNKRFIYSGQIKTAQVDLRKIIQIDPMDDGIGLHKENKEKTQYFTWTYFDNAWFVRGDKNAVRRASSRVKEIELSENGRRYNVPLTGEVLKAVIESAARRYSK